MLVLVVISLICEGIAWVVSSVERLLMAAQTNATAGLSALAANPPLELLLGFAAGVIVAGAAGLGVWMVVRRRI
jgi:hypothetical protein